ncbi:MAG: hypothetical protein NTX87_06895 [Planctomycetota bacterium]|nr:hypothetical protein [Planctomycetota bacterium]
MTTEERLENLERELARAKRCNHWLLAGLVLCLGTSVVVWALGAQGRYAVSGLGGAAYVLDTRTGQVWLRMATGGGINLGTNDHPKCENMKTE